MATAVAAMILSVSNTYRGLLMGIPGLLPFGAYLPLNCYRIALKNRTILEAAVEFHNVAHLPRHFGWFFARENGKHDFCRACGSIRRQIQGQPAAGRYINRLFNDHIKIVYPGFGKIARPGTGSILAKKGRCFNNERRFL